MYNHCMYHNPMHAADVMHATSYLLHGAIADKIPPEELLVVPPPSFLARLIPGGGLLSLRASGSCGAPA